MGQGFRQHIAGVICLCSMISRISVGKNRGLAVIQGLEAGATGSFVLSRIEPGLSVKMATSA